MDTLTNARRENRRVWFIVGVLLALFLFVGGFMGGRAMAYGKTTPIKYPSTCHYNSSHQLISGPSYCKQSNQSCIGTDVGGCVNGEQEVEYPGGCPQHIKYLGCSVSTQPHAAPSRFVRCTLTYHMAIFQPWRYTASGGQVPNGNLYEQYDAACTANAPAPTPAPPAGCTPNGQLTLHFLGCIGNGVAAFNRTNSCGSVVSSSHGAATRCDTGSSNPPGNGGGTGGNGNGGTGGTGGNGGGSSGGNGGGYTPPPACTPSSHTTYGPAEWTGCSAKNEESGYQSYTVHHSCPSYNSTGTRTVKQHTSTTCRLTIAHQCAYGEPGYAQQRTCLTSPLGGVTDCGNWSSPYYDPYDCPIPTPVGTY